MKRIMSFILALALVLSVAMVPTYAAGKNSFIPPGLAKKGGLPPGIAKKFMDIDRYEWARSAIEKMADQGVIKGVAKDQFAPSRNVTKVEALAMIIRVMGWDEEADFHREQIQNGEEEDRLKNRVQDWGKGYIEVALDQELIDDTDLAQENLNTPATRQEVAKYIIRAMDKDDEAQEYMDKNLRFKDKTAVEIGAVGYVYLIDKLEIMIGDNENNFQPNKPVTRAEMAALVEKVDGRIADEDTAETFSGVIRTIDQKNREITVKDDDTVRLFEVDRDTIIKIDGYREDFEDLMKGMTVEVFMEDDEVVKIYGKVEDEDTEETFSGTIRAIDENDREITVKDDDTVRLFEVDRDTIIKIDGYREDFEDLMEGMTVEVFMEDDEVVKIHGETESRFFEGRLMKVEVGSEWKITLRIEDEDTTFVVDDDVEIEIEDDDGDIEDLHDYMGDTIEIEVENNRVVEIDIED